MNNHIDGSVSIHGRISLTLATSEQDHDLSTLQWLVSRTRARPGCVSCHASQSIESPGHFFIDEVWTCQRDLERYLTSDDYRHLLTLLDLSTEPPEVRFCFVDKMMGLEALAEVRERNR